MIHSVSVLAEKKKDTIVTISNICHKVVVSISVIYCTTFISRLAKYPSKKEMALPLHLLQLSQNMHEKNVVASERKWT